MRIAVPFDKAAGTIAEQFERTEAFRLYNLENGQIVSSLSLPAFGTGNEAMAEFLKTARADVVICGGITARGRQLLGSEGIAVYPGFGGSADDAAQAFAWMKKLAEAGNLFGMYNVAMMYQYAYGTEENPREAYLWYRKAAEAGDAEAMRMTGWCIENRYGVEDAALEWYEKAAEAGDPEASAEAERIRNGK